MMDLKEIVMCASAFGNQIRAGIPLADAAQRLATIQPKYADFWNKTEANLRSGMALSTQIGEVWPESLINAVKAGEQSGRMDDVFRQIEETVELQIRIRKNISQIYYPLGMAGGGLAAFLGFMVFVFPNLARSFGSLGTGADNGPTGFMALSLSMESFFNNYWMLLAGALVVGVGMFAAWIKTEEARASIMDFCLGVPILGDALRDMAFGLWLYYMAMMNASGIDTAQGLRLTVKVLPNSLQEGVNLFERDLAVNNRPMDDSANPAKQRDEDPRKDWPFYVSNAFMVACHTGAIDRELLRVAPSLIKEGETVLAKVIGWANLAALFLAAFLIVAPLAAYYVQVFSAIGNAGH